MAEAKQMGDAAPLAGVRILDLTTIMLGPFASQQLGDYGADVIKIEAPGGDATRQIGPSPEVDMAAAFLGVNRASGVLFSILSNRPHAMRCSR